MRAADALHNLPELAVVHIQAMAEANPARVDAKLVALLDVVIDHGAQQVVGGGNGVQIARKVQVDGFHGHNLGVAAARCTALHAKHRAQGGLAQGEHGVFANLAHAVRQGYGYGGFALARGGGVDSRYQHQLCLKRQICVSALVNLGHIPAIGGYAFGYEPGLLCDVHNGFQGCAARNLQISCHWESLTFPEKRRFNSK